MSLACQSICITVQLLCYLNYTTTSWQFSAVANAHQTKFKLFTVTWNCWVALLFAVCPYATFCSCSVSWYTWKIDIYLSHLPRADCQRSDVCHCCPLLKQSDSSTPWFRRVLLTASRFFKHIFVTSVEILTAKFANSTYRSPIRYSVTVQYHTYSL